MVEIATTEPTELVAGDSLKFKKWVDSYLPSEGWVLTYALVKDGHRIDLTGSDGGDGYHLVTETAANTASYSPGEYSWQAYVTKATERYSISAGTITIKPDFAEAAAGMDSREHCKKVLDALELTIEGKATKDQQSYSIQFGEGGASRSISRLSFGELIEARKFYKNEYQRLVRRERVAQGKSSRRTIHARLPV